MYLSNVAGSKKKKTTQRTVARSTSERSTGGRSAYGRSMPSVSAGTYRNFLQDGGPAASTSASGGRGNHSKRQDAETVSTTGMSDAEWDPFHDDSGDPFRGGLGIEALDDESDFSFSESGFSDREWEDGERHGASKKESRRRPKEQKRVGRLGNRKTRSSRSDPRAAGRSQRGPSSTQTEEDASERTTSDHHQDDEEEDNGFTVSYIADKKRSSGRDDGEKRSSGSRRPPSSSRSHRSRRESRR